MLQDQSEEDPKECGSKDTALFDKTANVKGLGGTSVELHCPLHVGVEGLDKVLQLWWAADPLKHLEQPVSANRVERLGEVDESDVQGHILHFSWSWRREKIMSAVDLPARNPHCDSREDLFC